MIRGLGLRLWARIVAVLTAALAVLTIAAPAHALPTVGNGVCNAGNVCMWQLSGESGSLLDARTCEPDWYCGLRDFSEWWYFNSSLTPDNRTSSIWVRASANPYSKFTQYAGGSGGRFCMQYGWHFTQADLQALGMNDKISAFYTSDFYEC